MSAVHVYFSSLRSQFPSSPVFVGVHIRRTDYRSVARNRGKGGDLYGKKFYLRAMDRMAKHIGVESKGERSSQRAR